MSGISSTAFWHPQFVGHSVYLKDFEDSVSSAIANGSNTTNYQYRADVMRVAKAAGSDTQAFYYDGQMPIEDAAVVGSATTVTRNGLGARGIDYIATTTSSGTSVAYPIYDGHGNMVATLAKNGTGYSLNNRRSFGAWGEIRQGATSGAPKGRYCANLGHLDDDESGLTYMRARYYDSGSGRFFSSDTARHGGNWHIYCRNSPVNKVDPTGKYEVPLYMDLVLGGLMVLFGAYLYIEAESISLMGSPAAMGQVLMGSGVLLLLVGAVAAFADLVGQIRTAYLNNNPQTAEQLAFEAIKAGKTKRSDSAKIGAGLAELAFWMSLVDVGEEY